MRQKISKSLVPVDNIKESLIIYFYEKRYGKGVDVYQDFDNLPMELWKKTRGPKKRAYSVCILNPKYKYLMNQQIKYAGEVFQKDYRPVKDCWETINFHLKNESIPLRYKPKISKIEGFLPKEKWAGFVKPDNIKKYGFFAAEFDEAIIPLLEQKLERKSKLMSFLKLIASRSGGMDYEEYIEKWATEMTEKMRSLLYLKNRR